MIVDGIGWKRRMWLWAFCGSLLVAAASAQTPAASPSFAPRNAPPAIRIAFLPPPLENATFSVGIFDAKTGKLVRRLHEIAPASAFTAGLNGFATKWDRRDDAGNPVPPGKYSARGWAVGPLKVEGVDFLGNEWVDENEDLRISRVEALALVPADDGLVTLCRMADGGMELVRFSPPGRAEPVWRRKLAAPPAAAAEPPAPTARSSWTLSVAKGVVSVAGQSFALTDGSPRRAGPAHTTGAALPPAPPANVSLGRNETVWTIDESGLSQRSLSGAVLRQLPPVPNEPAPRAVAASEVHEKLYLLEETEGWQRVRGLEWADTRREASGATVSEWKTFFERSIRRPDPALGLDLPASGGGSATAKAPPTVVEQSLVKNPLLGRGKIATAKLSAGFNDKGSYLESSADGGLRLRKISERPHLLAVKMVKGAPVATAEKEKTALNATTATGSGKEGTLTFYQFDGAAWDVFSITGANQLMAFDAGEFELTATGEKLPEGEPKEPRDL